MLEEAEYEDDEGGFEKEKTMQSEFKECDESHIDFPAQITLTIIPPT
jgi:hypothetical protein